MPDGRDFDAVFYVRNTPEFRFEGGVFTICYTVGRANFEFVMQPNVFLKGLKAATELAGEFHMRDDVFAFKDGDEH